MSLEIKKIYFGNSGTPFTVHQKFGMPYAADNGNTILQPQTAVSLPQPAAAQPLQTASQYVTTVTPVPASPVIQNQGVNIDGKTLGFAAAGLALVSLGINGINALKGRSSRRMTKLVEEVGQKIIAQFSKMFEGFKKETQSSISSVEDKIAKETAGRIGLGNWQDGVINDLRKDVNKLGERLNETASSARKAGNFMTRDVNVNNCKMPLATTLHGYGSYSAELRDALRTEASKRMLGLIDRSDMTAPDKITVRVPTAEFCGLAKTGGMADVPREIIANLGAFINSKQDVRLILDMPMYLGEILYKSDEKGVTTVNYALNAIGNGKYNWVSKFAGKDGSDKIIAGNLEKIASAKIPVYDDAFRTNQDVEIYMARGIKQTVDYKLLKNYLAPDALAEYNNSIQNFENAYNKFLEETKSLRDKINTETAPLEEKLAAAEKELNGLIGEDREKASRDIAALKEQISGIKKPLEDLRKDFQDKNGNLWKQGILDLTGGSDGHIKAAVSFDGLFYKNEKFNMAGPRFNGSNKNIYDDKAVNAGEAERFAYFDKYFYEFLLSSHEYTNERLGADLIIGNDWHTGGISAMIRLLTKAREAAGLNAKEAEKLYNTPVVTILHNARLAGQTSHSNSKLLNILFGEHSAEIVENAWMPNMYEYGVKQYVTKNLNENPDTFFTCLETKKRTGKILNANERAADEFAGKIVQKLGLPGKCLNGLMHGNCVNPQTMATAYSDVIIPVSDKYMEEIAIHGVYGRENFELFRLRKFASDHPFKGQKTIAGITNGCDKVNNELTSEVARGLEKTLSLPKNSLRTYKEGGDVLEWHNHNKKVILERVIADVRDPSNPMKLSMREMTDLTGVNENTMIVSTAGRIVDQKGLDIFAEAIEEMLGTRKFPDGNYPVFYVQGEGDTGFINRLLEIKSKVAKSPELGGEAAAKRIVFANLFTEPGRYDACKIMSDFSIMSSWFEPCGLVHKQFAARSGAIPIVNKTGGLTSGLTDGADAVFSEFKPDYPSKQAVICDNKKYFAKALNRAYDIFNDKTKLNEMMTKSFNNDFSWLVENGPMAQYVKLFTDLKVLKPEISGGKAV